MACKMNYGSSTTLNTVYTMRLVLVHNYFAENHHFEVRGCNDELIQEKGE